MMGVKVITAVVIVSLLDLLAQSRKVARQLVRAVLRRLVSPLAFYKGKALVYTCRLLTELKLE